jgi:cytochrome c-type biogenesis protein CcmH/NrfG
MTRQLRDHAGSRDPILTQAEATGELGRFDRFAEAMSPSTRQAVFFAICVLMVLVPAPSYFAFGNLNTAWLADLMEHQADGGDGLARDVRRLEGAVGLEEHISA